jgi:hypothetical protein
MHSYCSLYGSNGWTYCIYSTYSRVNRIYGIQNDLFKICNLQKYHLELKDGKEYRIFLDYLFWNIPNVLKWFHMNVRKFCLSSPYSKSIYVILRRFQKLKTFRGCKMHWEIFFSPGKFIFLKYSSLCNAIKKNLPMKHFLKGILFLKSSSVWFLD